MVCSLAAVVFPTVKVLIFCCASREQFLGASRDQDIVQYVFLPQAFTCYC